MEMEWIFKTLAFDPTMVCDMPGTL